MTERTTLLKSAPTAVRELISADGSARVVRTWAVEAQEHFGKEVFGEHGAVSRQTEHRSGAQAAFPAAKEAPSDNTPTAHFTEPMLFTETPAPYVAGSPTSKAAAVSIDAGGTDSARKLQQNEVLAWFFTRRDYGGTCDELEIGTGMSHQSASARCADLIKAGYLLRSDMERKTRSGRAAGVLQAAVHAISP